MASFTVSILSAGSHTTHTNILPYSHTVMQSCSIDSSTVNLCLVRIKSKIIPEYAALAAIRLTRCICSDPLNPLHLRQSAESDTAAARRSISAVH